MRRFRVCRNQTSIAGQVLVGSAATQIVDRGMGLKSMKRNQKWIIASIINLVLAISFNTFSKPIATASQGAIVALFTPFAFFEKSLQTMMTTYSTQDQSSFPDQTVNVDGLNWHISGIRYQIQSEFTRGNLQAQSYDIQSRNLKMSISIQHISVDQVITSNQGGITLDVHVQANCAPVQLNQNSATASARIDYKFSPQSISTQVTEFNFQWPKQTWVISSLNCQGPAGIDSKIQAALANNLQSADTMKPYIQNALSQKIQDQVDNIVDQIKRPTPIVVSGNPLNLVLSFKQFQISKYGLMAYGQITWNGVPDASQITPLGIHEVPAELQNATEPVLITASQGWTNFIEAELEATPITTRINLNSDASFSQFLKSNFYEFFLWPDLMNYSLNSPFNLAISTPKLNALTWLKDGTAQIQISPTGWIESLRQGKVWNFVKLFGQAKAHISPQIIDGVFKVVASVQNTSVSYQYGSDYISNFRPNQFISPLIINKFSKNLETSFLYSNPLPSFDLGPIGIARFNGWVPINSGTHIAIPVKF